nr:Fhf1 [synthetic construct]
MQQVPDPNQGLRANWMRGSWAALWLPENNYNGHIEGVSIEPFIEQIKELETIDYIQIGLTNPNIYSPVHTAPHPIIESLWQGDVDPDGNPLNLVVPRASAPDPFLSWLKAIKAAGLKTEIYVNSYNLLARVPDGIPAGYPDLSERWEEYCNTNATAQAFIKNNPYISEDDPERRKYMFCYAEFILKEYSERYGDLIDAWCFDSADNIMGACGDEPQSDDVNHQRIYQAFADACHAGNPNAAISFNNSVGDRELNPFSTATYFDDYTFGHPFGGAGNMVEPRDPLYTYNYHVIEWMSDYNGSAFLVESVNKEISTDGNKILIENRAWNDNVVSHFFPKQSATSWNAGNTPCLTDEEFVEWTSTGIIDGGAITWGTPLVRTNLNNAPDLTLQPYALRQLALTDEYLKQNQFPGAPNWARQTTRLSEVIPGQAYEHVLVEGVDFWDPENLGSTNTILSIVDDGKAPDWLTLTETEEGVWTLGGIPTETTETVYTFELKAQDADGSTNRQVSLKTVSHPDGFVNPGDGSPVWKANPMILENTVVSEFFEYYLELGEDVYDFEGDDLSIAISGEAHWLNLEELSKGVWYLSGTPEKVDEGENKFTLSLTDGTHASETELIINVDKSLSTDLEVLIQAAADTNYGIGTVATMISEEQTGPDGIATYKLSIEITPSIDKAIISGISGGTSTEKSWGLGDGTTANSDDIFNGDQNEWVEHIGNIKIVDFNPNGGDLKLEYMSAFFNAVDIINGQSSQDRVSLRVGDLITEGKKMESNTSTFYLEFETGIENITEFAIGTGNEATTNKWSINGINVLVKFDIPLELVSLESTPLLCSRDATASASVEVKGGQRPYAYKWSDGQKTQTAIDLAAGDYTVQVTDKNGNSVTGSVSIEAIAPIEITMIQDQEIHIGYLTESVVLRAESIIGGTGDYTYEWSTGETSPEITVSPKNTTTYTLTVTDENDCATTKVVLVKVTDVSCGNNGAKVQICHNGHVICVSPNAVPAFLRKGAVLGSCDTEISIDNISVTPNPVASETTISVTSSYRGSALLQVFDLQGNLKLSNTIYLNEDMSDFQLNISNFISGVYIISINGNGHQSQPVKIIKNLEHHHHHH